MSRPNVSAEQIEARRRQALTLLEQGYSLNEAGRIVGSAPSSVLRWRESLMARGDEALKVRFSPGRPPILSATERTKLVEQLLRGAVASGFSDELWTTERVGVVIRRHSQARFHRSHVVRLMHALGFKIQGTNSGSLSLSSRSLRSGNGSARHGQKRLRGWVRVPHV